MKFNNQTRKYKLEKIDKNVLCPFCENGIKGEIPSGLKLKEIAKFIGELTLAEQFDKERELK